MSFRAPDASGTISCASCFFRVASWRAGSGSRGGRTPNGVARALFAKLGGIAKLRSRPLNSPGDRPKGQVGVFRRGEFESERGSGQKSASTELRRPLGYQEGLTMVRAVTRTTVGTVFNIKLTITRIVILRYIIETTVLRNRHDRGTIRYVFGRFSYVYRS